MRFGWIVLLLAASARGDVVLHEFSGRVERTVNGNLLFGDIPVAIGDVITGSVTYDTESPDLNFLNPSFGVYRQLIADGLRIAINGHEFTSSDYNIGILNDVNPFGPSLVDVFEITTANLTRDGASAPGSFSISLVDPTASVYGGKTLPSSADLADFAAPFDFNRGELTSFATSLPNAAVFSIQQFRPVPEPGGLALLAIGAVWLLRRR